MRPIALRTLTWATVAAAVLSALWLAATDGDPGEMLRPTASLLAPSSLIVRRESGTATVAAGRQSRQPEVLRSRPLS
jgi:hypothetical protein